MGEPPDVRALPHTHVLEALLALSSEAVALIGPTGQVSAWNQAAEDLLGWSEADLIGRPVLGTVLPLARGMEQTWQELMASTHETTLHATARTRSGSTLRVEVQVAPVAARSGAVMLFRAAPRPRDASGPAGPALLLTAHELRTMLGSPLATAVSRAVALLDVDALTLLNDTHGRAVGDQVLSILTKRLASEATGAAFGAWEDDSFLVVVEAVNAKLRLSELMDRLHQVVREPLAVSGHTLHVSVSAGLAADRAGGDQDLLPAASQALRLAKVTGRDRSVWFHPAMQQAGGPEPGLVAALDRGMRNDELLLHYQPIVDLVSGGTWAVEALVRWDRPGVGLVPPAGFIELAEQTGQIIQLGAWVTRTACRAAVDLSSPVHLPVRVSLNLSARQLGDQGVLSMLMTSLARAGCAPDLIEVEITETALMHDLASATERLLQMKRLGVGLALDDFGTGYSSLAYLKHFPVDRIKIDRSFVSGLGIDSNDTAIVASTITLAHSIGMRCIAEGVETELQLSLLRRMGCDYAQGYLLSRPIPFDQLQAWRPPPLPPLPPGPPVPRLLERPPHAARILELHAAGASLTTIAAALNKEGERTERGVRWSGSSVARVIAKSHYPGIGVPGGG